MSEYNPDWVIAVLEDLRSFCCHSYMPRSAQALDQALRIVASEAFPAPVASGTVVQWPYGAMEAD